jgi:HEAT repeat protein
MSTNPNEIPFQQVIDALLDIEKPLSSIFLYRFSDLNSDELTQLAAAWPKIPDWRRQALMEDIEELGDSNTILSFESLARFAMTDRVPEVRLPAVRTLWEYDDLRLAQTFLELIDSDPSPAVRAAAAGGLGYFIYLGEVEEAPKKLQQKIEERLFAVMNSDEKDEVKRNALEALAFSDRKEVRGLIETAFISTDKEWVGSSIFAMGRSANNIWKPQVLEMLDSQFPILRAEAARAAGELELGEAVNRLVELIDDPDDDTRRASIWSLSQLGGDGIRQVLEKTLEDSDNEEDRNHIENALDNLTFNEDMQLLPILDMTDTDLNPHKSHADDDDRFLVEAYQEDFDEEIDQEFDDEYDDDDDEGLDLEDELSWFEDEEEDMDED